jgi:hypothetical protein
MVIELVVQGSECILDFLEVHHPAGVLTDGSVHVDLDSVGVTMQASALVPVRDMGKPVCRLEGELSEDFRFDHGIPKYL